MPGGSASTRGGDDSRRIAAAVRYLRDADPCLIPVIEWAGSCRLRPERPVTLFVALTRAIVYQQLSGKAAATIFGRVCELFPGGPRGLTAARVLELSDADLRAAGLSRNKCLSLRDLAGRVVAGRLSSLATLSRLDDERIIDELTGVRGIGRWTAEMFLMFRLGRLDVLAVDDLGLRHGHALIVGQTGPSDRQTLARYGERWRPYRSVASWYLWRAVERARAPA
jgi:3-methyladenine DNA glycosylase/8-oxoguanine DNA glycosylase